MNIAVTEALSPQPPPEVIVTALKEFLGDDEQVSAILSDGKMLDPIRSGATVSYPIIYEHPEKTDDGVSITDLLLIDTDQSGLFNGFGNVSFVSGDLSHSVLKKPFVAYTETTKAAQGNGLGIQRARRMNDLSKIYFGNVLYSDPSGDTSDEAHRLWLRLVSNGEAESYDENGIVRYRFK